MAKSKAMETKKVSSFDYYHEIEKRAYELYQDRNKKSIHGDPKSDWYQAEKEIKSKHIM